MQSIRRLQGFIERNVCSIQDAEILQSNQCGLLREALLRCEQHNSYSEILCTINGIVARLKRLGSPVSKWLYFMGMRYSCLALCAPALQHHVEGYSRAVAEPLDFVMSSSLVTTLLRSLKFARLDHAKFSLRPMLQVVTGEGATHAGCKLQDILLWGHDTGRAITFHHDYVLLLITLRSRTALRGVLNKSLWTLLNSPASLDFAYAYAMGLVDSGRSDKAASYLAKVSKRCGGILPGLSEFGRLANLTADERVGKLLPTIAGAQQYAAAVERLLRDMETRFGIKWDPTRLTHTTLSYGNSISLDGWEQLIAEIQASGCSKSLDDLGKIASLLDEFDGTEIRVTLPHMEGSAEEFAWIPQRAPIEFYNDCPPLEYDPCEPWSHSSLGLVRAQFDSDGTLVDNERCLHLMQLGCLAARPRIPPNSTEETPLADRPSWRDTGHIVTWDRAAGGFLAIFIGEGLRWMEPGRPPRLLGPPYGLASVEDVSIPGHSAGEPAGRRLLHAVFHFDVEAS